MTFPDSWDFKKVQPPTNNEAIANVFGSSLGRQDPKTTLFVCIIPNKPSQQYGQVKQAAEWDGMAGVLTQCVQDKNFYKCDYSTIKNILLKINAKMRGINHVPLYSPAVLKNVSILSIPTLIIGMDVTHASVPIKGRPTGFPSYASVTGSLDRSGMPYMMHIQAQLRQDATKAVGAAEVVERLDKIIEDMIMRFSAQAKVEPKRIIVFRDGVGESQFPEILQKELMDIRRGCTIALGEKYKPPITFIAVQKRHKVRFFLEDQRDKNVPPGTVVDKEIVGDADFYLLSHKGMLVRSNV